MGRRFIFLCAALLGILQLQPSIDNEYDLKPETQEGFEVAIEALKLIESKDYEGLSEYIHPESGVVFAPYSTIYNESVVLTSEQIKSADLDACKYVWEFYNEEPSVELTIPEYFTQYVYDKDYLNVNQVAINSIIRQCNAIENVNEVFEDCLFVDFHYEGTEEYGYLDWSSLKVVMQKYNGEFMIVAIIHSSYTI